MSQDCIVEEIRRISEKNGIPGIIGLKGKFLIKFYEDVVCSNMFERKVGTIKRTGYYKISSFWVKSILYFFITSFTIIKTLRFKNEIKTKAQFFEQVIYIAAPFKIVKARNLKEVIQKVTVYYYPLSDLTFIGSHIKVFNSLNQAIYVDRFRFIFIIRTLHVFLFNLRKVRRFSREIDELFKMTHDDAIIILLKTIYASIHYRSFVSHLNLSRHVWLFEYHSSMEMLALQSAIKELRPNDITVHMQHGLMLEPKVIAYHHPITDYDIVCGEREVHLLSTLNKYHSIILGIGCPLQSIGYNSISRNDHIEYDLLILLTATSSMSALNSQIHVLRVLTTQNNLKILLRYRPASLVEDQIALKSYVNGMSVSNGSSIDEDVSKANAIISFSADALYHCFRYGKKTVLVVDEKRIVDEFYKSGLESDNFKVLASESFDFSIIELLIKTNEVVNYQNDAFVKYNFGCIDSVSYKKEFDLFLKRLVCC